MLYSPPSSTPKSLLAWSWIRGKLEELEVKLVAIDFSYIFLLEGIKYNYHMTKKQLVFIDESGDPGFRVQKGSSSVFVIALVIFDDDLEAEKTSLSIKELRRKLKVSDVYEFKFNKMKKNFRNKFFTAVKNYAFRTRAIVVNKESVNSPRLRRAKEDFYNYIIMQVLEHNNNTLHHAKLHFDKRGEKTLRDQLRVYLSNRLDNKNAQIFRDLKFVDSRQDTLVQLADMMAGAIFSSATGKDKSYLEYLKRNKKIEDLWLFK